MNPFMMCDEWQISGSCTSKGLPEPVVQESAARSCQGAGHDVSDGYEHNVVACHVSWELWRQRGLNHSLISNMKNHYGLKYAATKDLQDYFPAYTYSDFVCSTGGMFMVPGWHVCCMLFPG